VPTAAGSGAPDAEPGVLDAGPGESDGVLSSAGGPCFCSGVATPKPPVVVQGSQPSPVSLHAYKGHAVAFLGRNLWCLECFQAPGKAHRSWRHGRCDGTRPAAAMPAALRHALARQAEATPELPKRTRDRWTELVGALGSSSVLQ
jgi:hypothetical protein